MEDVDYRAIEQDLLSLVQKNAAALEYIERQTPEMCIAAVEQDPMSLYYVKNKTPEIALAAVKKNGFALYYVEDQTPKIVRAAVMNDPIATSFIDKSLFYDLIVQNFPKEFVAELIIKATEPRTLEEQIAAASSAVKDNPRATPRDMAYNRDFE